MSERPVHLWLPFLAQACTVCAVDLLAQSTGAPVVLESQKRARWVAGHSVVGSGADAPAALLLIGCWQAGLLATRSALGADVVIVVDPAFVAEAASSRPTC